MLSKNKFCILIFVMIMLFSLGYSQNYLQQQKWDIDGTYYWRLTRNLAENKLNQNIFALQSASQWIRVKKNSPSPARDIAVRITTDPWTNRIIYSDYDRYIKSYGDHNGQIQFNNPTGICRFPYTFHNQNGNLETFQVPFYVVDSGNNRIVELIFETNFWVSSELEPVIYFNRAFAGAGGSFGNLNKPSDVVYKNKHPYTSQAEDFLWVSDTDNHRIVKISLNTGEIVKSFGSVGTGNNEFRFPKYLAFDEIENELYVVDLGNDRIVWLKEITGGMDWLGEYNYTGEMKVHGIVCDRFGNLWITDALNHQIHRFNERLKPIFSDCGYGTGQNAGGLDTPLDTDIFYRTVIENSAQWLEDTELFFVTENWAPESGQVYYRTIPKYIPNSLYYYNLWRDNTVIIGPPNSPESAGFTDDDPGGGIEWIGTTFYFKITDVCYLSASITDRSYNPIRNLFTNNFKTPGLNYISWDARDDNGVKVQGSLFSLHLTLKSVYDQSVFTSYTFDFNNYPEDKKRLTKNDDNRSIVYDFRIFQNYPNPFNSNTIIKYQIPEKGKIKLVIYNILGQKVKTLIDDFKDMGSYTVYWNGMNEENNYVSSGVYIYHLTFENTNIREGVAKKLLLIK